jgi:hypothetical protein
VTLDLKGQIEFDVIAGDRDVRLWTAALNMSALEGEADITIYAPGSANDPLRTFQIHRF